MPTHLAEGAADFRGGPEFIFAIVGLDATVNSWLIDTGVQPSEDHRLVEEPKASSRQVYSFIRG